MRLDISISKKNEIGKCMHGGARCFMSREYFCVSFVMSSGTNNFFPIEVILIFMLLLEDCFNSFLYQRSLNLGHS